MPLLTFSNPCRCEHRPHRPWPAFKELDPDDWQIVKTEQMIIKDELICFHTKVPYDQKPLGIGLRVKRNARTSEIQSITTTFDPISIYAFNNLGVRRSVWNFPFHYWLPLYINEGTVRHFSSNTFRKWRKSDESCQEVYCLYLPQFNERI